MELPQLYIMQKLMLYTKFQKIKGIWQKYMSLELQKAEKLPIVSLAAIAYIPSLRRAYLRNKFGLPTTMENGIV